MKGKKIKIINRAFSDLGDYASPYAAEFLAKNSAGDDISQVRFNGNVYTFVTDFHADEATSNKDALWKAEKLAAELQNKGFDVIVETEPSGHTGVFADDDRDMHGRKLALFSVFQKA